MADGQTIGKLTLAAATRGQEQTLAQETTL